VPFILHPAFYVSVRVCGYDLDLRANDTQLFSLETVYTFLATLVLLLSVSGAIVFRSFVLRRRHRMMVEEAIRNGTWVPAMGGLYGGEFLFYLVEGGTRKVRFCRVGRRAKSWRHFSLAA